MMREIYRDNVMTVAYMIQNERQVSARDSFFWYEDQILADQSDTSTPCA